MLSTQPTIHLAADHAGFALKEAVKTWLITEGFKVVDYGANVLDKNDDFPDFIAEAARAVHKKPKDRGVIFGGSGQGEAMMANRFKKVRATVYYGGIEEIVHLSREHNDANVLSVGARFVPEDEAKQVIWTWLHLDTSEDKKYHRRNKKLDTLS